MIRAECISLTLSGRAILHDVSLALEPGTLMIVVGPNGAGKTTLMRALCGDLFPPQGKVTLDGASLRDWRGPQLARRRAVLPQTSHLAFPFTVYEVVALGRAAGPAQADPREALRKVGLEDYEGRFYQQLSGGEQQRVQLARVLCQIGEPVRDGAATWLFLDEPTSNLDIRHQFAILGIARSHAGAGGGAVAILHDLNMASLYADRLIVMSEGTVVADGRPSDVMRDAILETVFGIALKVNTAPAGDPPFVLPHSAVVQPDGNLGIARQARG